MTQFFLFIIKIIFSIICCYIIVYNFIDTDINNKHYKKLSLLTLIGSSLLSTMYSMSIRVENYNLFILSILLFSIISNYYIRQTSNKLKYIYLLSFCCTLFVSSGLILYSFLIIGVYYFLDKNLFFRTFSVNVYDNQKFNYIDANLENE